MKPAIQIVHWPGKDTPACEDHLRKLVGLGAMLGFMVTWTPCSPTICTNCVSALPYDEREQYQAIHP